MSKEDKQTKGTESFSVNFTDNSVPYYEENDYCVIATDYEMKEAGKDSNNPGAPIVAFKLVMAEGGTSDGKPFEKGDKLCDHRLMPTLEQTQGMITSFMIAVGLVDPETPKGTKMNFVPRECLNKPFMVHLCDNTYTAEDGTDKLNNKIKYVFPVP